MDDEGQMADDERQGATGEPANDKMEILSYEEEHGADQPEQGEGVGQCLPESKIENPESKISTGLESGEKTAEKAPNEPNLESAQTTTQQELRSENPDSEGRERTQSAGHDGESASAGWRDKSGQ